jgi:hypothetical protein
MDVIVPAALVSVAPTVITDAASVGHHPGYFEYTFSNPAAVVAAKAPPSGDITLRDPVSLKPGSEYIIFVAVQPDGTMSPEFGVSGNLRWQQVRLPIPASCTARPEDYGLRSV